MYDYIQQQEQEMIFAKQEVNSYQQVRKPSTPHEDPQKNSYTQVRKQSSPNEDARKNSSKNSNSDYFYNNKMNNPKTDAQVK